MRFSMRSTRIYRQATRSTCTVGAGLEERVQLWGVTSSDEGRAVRKLWINSRPGGEGFRRVACISTPRKRLGKWSSSGLGQSMTINCSLDALNMVIAAVSLMQVSHAQLNVSDCSVDWTQNLTLTELRGML